MDDLDELVTLHVDTVLVAYRDFFPPEADKPDPRVLRDLWQRDLETAHAVIVATNDDVVIGSAVARVGGDLARLHVHPSHWRHGVGRRLHDAAVEELRSAGYVRARLRVIERNAPARSLYERAGWDLDPTQTIVDRDVVEVRYVLEL